MRYALLFYSTEANLPERMAEDDREAFYAEFRAANAEIAQIGEIVVGARLETTETATTVRRVDGEVLTTDGPFAETKECLAGLLVVEAKDLDEALSFAARVPSSRVGCVEVRPIKY